MSNPRKRTLDPQPSEKAGLSEGLKISLLGGFLIQQGEQSFGRERFRLHKACDLIKLLALAPRYRMQRDELVEWLWPEGDTQGSANRLSQVLHSARQVLEAMQPPASIRFEDDSLVLYSDAHLQVDVEDFEAAASQAHQSDEIASYQTALALYT
jgi:DNA-binding SARP family transcriptional activator